jgi:hypothetical protein
MPSTVKRVTAAALIAAGLLTSCSSAPELPRCSEDRLLRGWGTFRDGRWEHYSCDVSTIDLPTYEQTLDLEKLAECPEVERGPDGRIALFDDGYNPVHVQLADGSGWMSASEFINACLR